MRKGLKSFTIALAVTITLLKNTIELWNGGHEIMAIAVFVGAVCLLRDVMRENND